MIPVHTDSWHAEYRAACPECDLGLSVMVPWRADSPIAWVHDSLEVESCPRCAHRLPTVDYNHGSPRLVAA